MGIKLMLIWKLAQMAYSKILRDLLVKAIDDPDEVWDDFTIAFADMLFSIEEFTFEPIWEITQEFYKQTLRPLLLKAVKSTETKIDDFGLKIVDKIFEYSTV